MKCNTYIAFMFYSGEYNPLNKPKWFLLVIHLTNTRGYI